MLLNNKLEKEYSWSEKELPSYIFKSFSFRYGNNNNDEYNKNEINKFLKILSKQKGDIDHFGLILGVEENPFISYVSICDCGHVHKYFIDKDNYEYRWHKDKYLEKLHLDKCSNCGKSFTEDLKDYSVTANENFSMNGLFFSGIDNESKSLLINLYQYMFCVKSDSFDIEFEVEEKYNLKELEYNSSYKPFDKYAGDFFNEWWDYYDEDITHLGPFYTDLYETIFNFNPSFKEFLRINESSDKDNKSFFENNRKTTDDIHLFMKYYYVFCNFYNYYKKYAHQIQKSITNMIFKLDNYELDREQSSFISNTIDSLKPLENNAEIVNRFFKEFEEDSSVSFEDISSITARIPWMKELLEANISDYLKYYIQNKNFSLDDLLSLAYVRSKYNKIDTKTFLKYIIRGTVNEEEKITKIAKQLSEMKDKNYNIEIKGAYQSKIYKKFDFIKNFNENEQKLFIELENKNTFDSVYKELMAF